MQRTGGLLCFMEWRKTMVVDFRKTRTTLCCVSILGEEVEVVERHKYSYFKSFLPTAIEIPHEQIFKNNVTLDS